MSNPEEAAQIPARSIEELWQAKVYGILRERTFRDAVDKCLEGVLAAQAYAPVPMFQHPD